MTCRVTPDDPALGSSVEDEPSPERAAAAWAHGCDANDDPTVVVQRLLSTGGPDPAYAPERFVMCAEVYWFGKRLT